MRMTQRAAAYAAVVLIVSWGHKQASAQVQFGELPAPLGETRPMPPKPSIFHFPPSAPMDVVLSRTLPTSMSQTAQPRQCRAGRRALIGALIGAGASVPLAKLAHDRFENEAASGPKAAATTVLLSAGAGALIGLATCR